MATYDIQTPSPNGTLLSFHTAASGDKLRGVRKNGRLTVNNAGSSMTVSVTPPGKTGYGVTNPAKVITCPVGISEITLLPEYRDATDSYNIALTWSSTTSVTWAAIA